MHSTDSAGGACDRLTIGIPSKWPLPPKASFHLLASIHDEQFGAVGRITAVGFATVADLITHSRTKNLHAAVFQLGVQYVLNGDFDGVAGNRARSRVCSQCSEDSRLVRLFANTLSYRDVARALVPALVPAASTLVSTFGAAGRNTCSSS